MHCTTRLLLLAGLAAGLMAVPGQAGAQEQQQAAAKPQPRYVGVDACGKCHKSERKGNQLGKWQSSRHAQAYAVLATAAAKEVAQQKGIADPQKSGDCLKCHVTAYGVDAACIVEPKTGQQGYTAESGVGCESCHGAGSEYMTMKTMRDRQAAVASGLIVPNESTCTKCHNAGSPTFKGFNYQEMLERVKHPNPLEGAGGSGESEG